MNILNEGCDLEERVRFADNLFNEALQDFENGQYKICSEKMNTAHKIYLLADKTEKISICLTFLGLTKYLSDRETYKSSLLLLEDARFLAQDVLGENAWGVSKWAFALIAMNEKNYIEALLYLNRAAYMVTDYPYILMRIYESLTFLNFKTKNYERAYECIAKAKELAESCNIKTAVDRINGIHKDLNESSEAVYTESLNKIERPQDASIPSDPLIALLKIARTISAEIDLDRLLTTIAEQTKFALKADRCTVFLIDRKNNELWSKVALGMQGHQEIRFPMDKGLAGHVAMTGETINIQNVYNDDRFNRDIDIQTGYKTSNILCMPIRNLKYEIIGVFQVINKYEGSFTDMDEDLLVTIGSSAGIALENNRLFETQQKMIEEQKKLFNGFIDTLAASIDARDKITAGHSMRVTLYSNILCQKAGIDKEHTETISQAAMLHDIGKIGIKDSVLQKKGKLTNEEYHHIQTHVKITHDILSKIAATSESFKDVVEIASSHHEKFNGQGYFRHQDGLSIPLGGRILAVADVFDAITSIRHYRDRMPIQDAIKIIREGADNHFDRRIVDLFLSVTCDKIIDVILSDSDVVLDLYSRKILEQHNLFELEKLINSPEQSDEDKKYIDTFNTFYIHNIERINVEE
ncbi:MAG: GAF domain-containing protein [Candidatus Gastranaerophilales bacterium]|nr:GAF domain-containing protein [Candidatus Gastranaerophilales bacterium]